MSPRKIIKTLVTLLFAFPVFVLACGGQEKPTLIIERDFSEEPRDRCGYYLVVVPTLFKNAKVKNISVKYGEALRFPLVILPHDHDEDLSMSPFCATPAWLHDARLSIIYGSLPDADDVIRLCGDLYEYDDLPQLIKE